MTTEPLFHVEPTETASAAGTAQDMDLDVSAGRRRTQRQAQLLAAGWHPLSAVTTRPIRLHPGAAPAADRKAPGVRCGSCAFRKLVTWHNSTYPKCTFGLGENQYLDESPRVSHGSATDIRRWWPACNDYQPREAS